MYQWEGNYVLDGREVLLAASVETTDAVGNDGLRIVSADLCGQDGEWIALTTDQLTAINSDPDLYERIEDQWRDETERQMESRR